MSKTPNGSRIVIIDGDGVGRDITDAVGTLYDLLAGSMDWGSDFLTVDDAVGFVRLVDLAGYADPDLERVTRDREMHAAALRTGVYAKRPVREQDLLWHHSGATKRTLLQQARDQISAKEASE